MNELSSILSLIAIAAFLLGPYNTLRVDRLRQQVFALRDELFDRARKGEIRFDSAAYMATRTLLNGMIRFSHRISFSRLFAFRMLMTERAKDGAPDDLASAMNASSEADRELCKAFILHANVLVLRHVMSSPLVVMFLFPQVLVLIASRIGIDVAGRLVDLCKRQFADLDRLALREGRA